MRGQTTLIVCLAILLIAGATTCSAKAADADGTLRTLSGARLQPTANPPGAAGAAQVAQGPAGMTVGGACSYREVPGSATIVRVAKTPASAQQARTAGGPGYEGVEVGFKFAPSQPIADATVRKFAQSTHPLRLTNSWYPGPRYIEKYRLSQGRKVPALLKVRTSGACTPMLFAFPGIDLADYFELAQ